MNALHQAGEAILTAHEGQAQLATLLAAATRRAAVSALDWCARALARTGVGTPHAG